MRKFFEIQFSIIILAIFFQYVSQARASTSSYKNVILIVADDLGKPEN